MFPVGLDHNPFEIARSRSRPLILDGAMGSYLQESGFQANEQIWFTNINRTHPDIILKIHEGYIKAGADVITTNTFRTNPEALRRIGISDYELCVKDAVSLGIKSIEDRKIIVAGSNPPAEDCYQVERTISKDKLEYNHQCHIDLLIDNGVHFILNETQSHFDEIQVISDHCDKENIPYVVSLYFNNTLKILSGESVEFIISYLRDHNCLAIGFNCIAPLVFRSVLEKIELSGNWGFYLNCGAGNQTDKSIICGIQPDEYINSVRLSLQFKPSFIGSCCGSNPAHIMKIKEFIDGKNNS